MTQQDDQDVWAKYASQVKKLGEKEPLAPKKKPVPPQRRQPEKAPVDTEFPALLKEAKVEKLPIETIKPQAPPNPPRKREALDPRVERNMSLGDVVIEARLDLHGQTEQEAYVAFRAFVETHYARGRRMVLVITGKGGADGSVLRQNLPRWSTVPPFDAFILAVRTAATHHGGEGAYYVLLRRKQEKDGP